MVWLLPVEEHLCDQFYWKTTLKVNVVTPALPEKYSNAWDVKYLKVGDTGDMQLGVPPLDPMGIPFLQIRKDEPNLSLDIIMKNVNILGFTDIQLAKVT